MFCFEGRQARLCILLIASLVLPACAATAGSLDLKKFNVTELKSTLTELRKARNSKEALSDVERLYDATENVELVLKALYDDSGCNDTQNDSSSCGAGRPGNLHDFKSHSYYVGAISEAHPSFPLSAVQSIVASEWYHPGLTAKSVWCLEDCKDLPLAERLNRNFKAIQQEVQQFWTHPESELYVKGVGSHTTEFDRDIAGNGTWVDVRLWRGRAFNKHLCERHFRLTCSIVETSPEVWTNPWSHVLLSVLLPDSWVPFHNGHTNGQLTYHLPVMLPDDGSVAELALLEQPTADVGGSNRSERSLWHPEERTVSWQLGKTLVFDDSYTHAVRYRSAQRACVSPDCEEEAPQTPRVVLLMRAWHHELEPEERSALRDFIRRGGEEHPSGYELLPVSPSSFGLSS